MRSAPVESPKKAKFRDLQGAPRTLELVFLASIILLGMLWLGNVPFYVGITVFQAQYTSLFWALVMATVFLVVPAGTASRTHVPWFDWIAILLALVVGLNVTANYQRIVEELGYVTPDKWVLGAIAIVLVIEATRRLFGRSLLIILLGFLLYGFFAEYMPGVLEGNRSSPLRLMTYLYLDPNALLGIPVKVASSIVLIYVLLGNALFATGGGQFFTDLAMGLMGRYRGGPAKIAIGASTLFGMISGSSVSNVVTTGIITIPMMKKNGYRPEVAAAVEAVASTGGQLVPPVMGTAGFLIAEFLELPYEEVVLASIVPAFLYYLLLFIQVDLEAARFGIRGIQSSEVKKTVTVLREGWMFSLPLIVLVYGLFWRHYAPGKAGLVAVASVLLLTLVKKSARLDGARVMQITQRTGRGLLEIGVITSVAGIIIGVLSSSGLGFNISFLLVALGGKSLALLLVLTAAVCIVLGMGMPTVPVYILLAVLVAPALEELGLLPLSAHFFIFYFGLLSMITPPVAIASYAAATLAESPPIRTSWEGVRLGAMAYIVPFIFVYSPALLLKGSLTEILWAVAFALCGAYALGVGLSGYLFKPLSLLNRFGCFVSAAAQFIGRDAFAGQGAWLNLAGLALGAGLILLERSQAKREPHRPVVRTDLDHR